MSNPPVDSWTHGASGAWSLASNWGLGRAPKSGDDVDIDAGAGVTVTFDATALTLYGLAIVDDALVLQGGALATSHGAVLTGATLTGVKPLTLGGATTITGLTLGGSAVLCNRGTVTQSGGAVAIGDGVGSTAKINNTASATWTIADASGLTQGATTGYRFYNSGLFQKTSGAGHYAWIYANFYSTGVIASAVNGDIIFDGKMTKLSGTYIGAGMVDYGPDGVATLGPIDVTLSSCQSNFGTVNLVGDMTMHDGSTLQNAAGARWNFAGDVSLLLAAGETPGPDIYGPGAIAKIRGTGISHVSVDAEIAGAVSVLTGTLSFEGATSTFSSTIAGAGTFEIGGGGAEIEAGAKLSVAHWTLAGGDTTLGEKVAYSGAFSGEAGAILTLGGTSASLTLTGPPVISGQDSLSGLDVEGSGNLIVRVDTIVSGAIIGGTVNLVDQFVVSQTGDVTLGDASVSDQARLTIGSSGSWNIMGSAGIGLGADAASAIAIGSGTGSGVLNKAGAGVSVIAPNVINNGQNIPAGGSGYEPRGVNVEGGTLDFQGAISGTGSDNISGTGSNNYLTETTLEFDRAVSTGQSVVFFDIGAALYLTDLPEFHASIVNFDALGSGDYLLIGGGYQFLGADETSTSTKLSFSLAGKSTQTLTLAGDYEGKTFAAATDSNGVLRLM